MKKNNQNASSGDENYWAILIEPDWITSSVWQIKEGKVDVVCTSPATRWEMSSESSGNDLVESVDASLSSCMQILPDDTPDPSKTVFGLPSTWLEDGNIKDEYLEKLKVVCSELSLSPSGFVVLSEAISHFIKQEEGTALSGIVVGINRDFFDISIFNIGKLIGTTNVLRSVSIEEDVVEGISRLSGDLEILPSRVVLYNQNENELEEVRSVLNDMDWTKIGKSPHLPRVEILDSSKKILAIALAGGAEIGDVTGMISHDLEKKEEVEYTKVEEIPSEELNNFEKPNDLTAADLGFTVGNMTSESVRPQPATHLPSQLKFSLSSKLDTFFSKIKAMKVPKTKMPQSLMMFAILIVTFIVVGFCFWWFVPKATVTIYVSPKNIEQSLTLSVGEELKSEEVSVEVNGDKTIPTTGTKTVGEKAKGQVKIQNGTGESINLKAGTLIASSSDLKFVTTRSASISAALSTTEPGLATVDVEASNIGSEFNLSKDEKFKVSNYPKVDVEAVSIEPFVGGTSRQITSVSDDDRKKLLKDLKAELIEDAKSKLNEKISEDQLLVESSFEEEIIEEDFGNKVGDEATNLNLSLTLKIIETVVLKSELASISRTNLEDKIPSGFVLNDDQIKYDFEKSSKKDSFQVNISANLLPSIDSGDVAEKISGRYPSIAEEYLSSIAGFVEAEIRISPAIKGKLGTLPHIPSRIEVIVTAEK